MSGSFTYIKQWLTSQVTLMKVCISNNDPIFNLYATGNIQNSLWGCSLGQHNVSINSDL